LPLKSAFAGFRFPQDVIIVAVRWYPRFNLSYCDIAELLVERGAEVDHVTVYRSVSQQASSRRSPHGNTKSSRSLPTA
jgi:transposase-like protein